MPVNIDKNLNMYHINIKYGTFYFYFGINS